MACIYRRGNRFWISYYVGAKQIKKSLGTDNEHVARAVGCHRSSARLLCAT